MSRLPRGDSQDAQANTKQPAKPSRDDFKVLEGQINVSHQGADAYDKPARPVERFFGGRLSQGPFR
jgi:hypothetical protein